MRRALPGFAAVALLATFSPGVPARAAPNVSADVAKAPESVEYLVSTYGVTPAEAVRRLRVQAASPEIGSGFGATSRTGTRACGLIRRTAANSWSP